MTPAERDAERVLEKIGAVSAPVPVEQIALRLGARVSYKPFEGDLSGLIYREARRVVIAIKASDPTTRQRFTIAHEIGHLRLHPGRPIIVDRFVRLGNKRDIRSGLAIDREEIEANAFAAHLLMPADLIRIETERRLKKSKTWTSKSFVSDMASGFHVSLQAMAYRLQNLGILYD
jgi:Zn-dependent peptidase ImmA (M78 family)